MMPSHLLVFSTAIATLAGSALAQCSRYPLSPAGTVLIDADDAIRNVALPFPFPFNGNLYSTITISTNGWIKLGTSASASSDLGDTEALMLSAEPRIAVCWDDLNPGPTGSGDLYYHADASQASIVWQGVQRFGTTMAGTLANCECTLLPNGAIYLNYDASSTFNLSNSTSIVGISAGGNLVPAGTHLVDWTAANPGPIAVADATAYQMFPIGAFDLLGGVTLAFVPTGLASFDVVQVPTPASCPQLPSYPSLAIGPVSSGTGCPVPIPNRAIYEAFTIDTGANPVDTQNTSILFTGSGSTYVAVPGPGWDASYTLGTVVPAMAADDLTVNLPITAMPGGFPFSNLSVTSVGASTNGFLWLDGSTASGYPPSEAAFLGGGPRIAGVYKDLNLSASGGGTVYVNDTPAYFMVTWENAKEFANPTSISTFQIKLHANGDIEVNTLTANSISDVVITGITRGAATATSSDLVTAGAVNVVGPVNILGVPATPITHTSTQMAFSKPWNLSASLGANHNNIGVFVAGFANPALPLDFLGATGCTLYATMDVLFPTVFVGTSFSYLVAVMPYNNSLAGLTLYSQAAALTNDNAFGIITSNGLSHTFGL